MIKVQVAQGSYVDTEVMKGVGESERSGKKR